MAIVQTTAGQLQAMTPSWTPTYTYGSMRLYGEYYRTYAALYREQPNVRVCVEFLARNIAQLGLHVFRRVSDTDRVRLVDHGLARIIKQPLPAQFKRTRFRLFNDLVSDLGIYWNAYWLKVRGEGEALGLLRIPPDLVTVKGGLVITGYEVNLGGRNRTYQPDEIVHIYGYNPEDAKQGLPPLETLRRVLAEEHASGQNREFLWKNAARMGGIIERPAEAPEWSDPARRRFLEEWAALYSGEEASGTTAVLEDGMTWKPGTFSPREAEYISGRKLTREECARAYHIPLPLVGILDNATFSNIKEQHKHLYQDCLGPWMRMIEEDLEMQLLPEFADVDGVYLEFNIQEKLAGSFDEQITSFQSAVGRPWMTPDEARARLNMPSLGGDADELATPLNVLIGGQASPRDSAPDQASYTAGTRAKAAGIDTNWPQLRAGYEKKWRAGLTKHYRRQEAAIVSRVPKAMQDASSKVDLGGIWWDEERWNAELQDLLGLNVATAIAWAREMLAAMGAEVDEEELQAGMMAWLEAHSRVQAEYINDQTRDALAEALLAEDPHQAVKDLFGMALSSWAARQALSGVTTASNFGAYEGATAGGLRTKTWVVNSSNPRDTHLRMDGETVGIRERFSNGMRFPGDPAGGAENNANCRCSVFWGR
jgi:HK97 family phage portal protein